MNEWWNDSDKVGGLVATCIVLSVCICVLALSLWFFDWLVFG